MKEQVDIKAIIENLGVRQHSIFPMYRPHFEIEKDRLTTGLLKFDGEIKVGETKEVEVEFICPEYYSNSLWVGKKVPVREGAKTVAYATVTAIINPILDIDKEKYIVIDGRDINNINDFYEEIQKNLTKEPINLIFIYAKEIKTNLGNKQFKKIIELIKEHESHIISFECYEEHVWEKRMRV